MKAKDKAIELINKFSGYVSSETMLKHNDENRKQSNAKECALICVDEILNSEPINPSHEDSAYRYWEEVKQEIEKL